MKKLTTFFLFLLIVAANLYSNTSAKFQHDYNIYKCDCSCESCSHCTGKKDNGETGNDGWGYYDCGTIGGRDFSSLKKLISDKSFESTKIEIAKSGIDFNYFKAEQVKELLQLFSFESSKVEIAKYAFTKTCDRKAYFKIYDVFSFESSIGEVEDYIKGKK